MKLKFQNSPFLIFTYKPSSDSICIKEYFCSSGSCLELLNLKTVKLDYRKFEWSRRTNYFIRKNVYLIKILQIETIRMSWILLSECPLMQLWLLATCYNQLIFWKLLIKEKQVKDDHIILPDELYFKTLSWWRCLS